MGQIRKATPLNRFVDCLFQGNGFFVAALEWAKTIFQQFI
jgi:hypothetical protein